MRFFIGDVRDYERLNQVMDSVDFVICCRSQQVPAAEYNPMSVKTNTMEWKTLLKQASTIM